MGNESLKPVPFSAELLTDVESLFSEDKTNGAFLNTLRKIFEVYYGDDGDERDPLLRGVREIVTRGLISLDDYLPEKPAESLTVLQEKIWRLLSQGYDRMQIAKKLEYGDSSSFQSPMNELFCRLGVPNKYAAAAMGVRMGKDNGQNG